MRSSTLLLSVLLHGAALTGAALVVHGAASPPPEMPTLGVARTEAQAPAHRTQPPPPVKPEAHPETPPELLEPVEPFDPESFELPPEPTRAPDPRRFEEPARADLDALLVAKPEPEPVIEPEPPREESATEPEPTVEAVAPAAQPSPDVEARVLDDNRAPPYPRRARQLNLEGDVWVSVTVDATGRAVAVRLAKACPHPVLNRAALRAVRKWRFAPARRGGEHVDAEIVVPVEFRLH